MDINIDQDGIRVSKSSTKQKREKNMISLKA